MLFTQDSDLLQEAARRQKTGDRFAGVVYVHPLNATIGRCVQDLELIGRVSEPEDFESWVEYLPLR